MEVIAKLWGMTYLIGPILLLGFGILVNSLAAHEHEDHVFFFGTEMAISNLGTLLSALIATKAADTARFQAIVALGVWGVVWLLIIARLTRGFSHMKKRPKLKMFMLGGVGNAGGVLTMAVTLYYVKQAV